MSSMQLRTTTALAKPRRLAVRGVKALPIPGYSYRWNPSSLSLADGAQVGRLPDLIGGVQHLMGAGGGSPVLGTEASGVRYLENTSAQRMTTNLDIMDLATATLIVVAKIASIPSGSGLIMGTPAPNVTIGVNQGKLYGGAGTALYGPNPDSALHVFQLTLTGGASSVFSVDGQEWVGNIGTNRLTEVMLFGGDNTNVMRGRIYDSIVYPFALNPDQRALTAAHLLTETALAS